MEVNIIVDGGKVKIRGVKYDWIDGRWRKCERIGEGGGSKTDIKSRLNLHNYNKH